jgi:hypothetical protein
MDLRSPAISSIQDPDYAKFVSSFCDFCLTWGTLHLIAPSLRRLLELKNSLIGLCKGSNHVENDEKEHSRASFGGVSGFSGVCCLFLYATHHILSG